ncbi:LysE family translocator [Methylocystis bryophila]|uniref:Lysine transporter LysE n=1 Tax=Methylocystis bryophila TaxID=655015 RepID=A0A1W6MVH1_9HYPH|nr:LysE family translocator [Methylocystis bryophila]ARN81479.1 lysine transporter LysE [Methylocystis bryophila]BDV37495.1 transporter [Methylocystis bryophila]
MSLHLYFAFLATATVLILIPGPNVALIVANSLAHGARNGLWTVAGTSTAMLFQLALTVLGLSAALSFLAEGFEMLRWIGVAYLVYLGVKTWRAPPVDLARTRAQADSRRAALRGFLVSLTNPKTLLFFGAFLPQFISAEAESTGQLVLLAGSFLALAMFSDSMWALLAHRLRGALTRRQALRNRLTGGLLLGAGVGLALARRP